MPTRSLSLNELQIKIQSKYNRSLLFAAINRNESLTLYRKRLFGRILDIKKNHHFKYPWASNGKTGLCESDTSTTYLINNLNELIRKVGPSLFIFHCNTRSLLKTFDIHLKKF